jgi:hypothetical protein
VNFAAQIQALICVRRPADSCVPARGLLRVDAYRKCHDMIPSSPTINPAPPDFSLSLTR